MKCKSTLTTALTIGLFLGFTSSAMAVEPTTFPTKSKSTKTHLGTKAKPERKGSTSKKCEGSSTTEGKSIQRKGVREAEGFVDPEFAN